MFYTLLNLSPLWKDSSENKRRSRIMIMGTSFYILAYSYLQSSMASANGYALMLKNYIKYIIGLDVLFMIGLQMKNVYDKPKFEQIPHHQYFQNQQMHDIPQQPIQVVPHQQLPVTQLDMPRPEIPQPEPQQTQPVPHQYPPSPPQLVQPSPPQLVQPSPPQLVQPLPPQLVQPSPPIQEKNQKEPEFEIPVYNKST